MKYSLFIKKEGLTSRLWRVRVLIPSLNPTVTYICYTSYNYQRAKRELANFKALTGVDSIVDRCAYNGNFTILDDYNNYKAAQRQLNIGISLNTGITYSFTSRTGGTPIRHFSVPASSTQNTLTEQEIRFLDLWEAEMNTASMIPDIDQD